MTSAYIHGALNENKVRIKTDYQGFWEDEIRAKDLYKLYENRESSFC